MVDVTALMTEPLLGFAELARKVPGRGGGRVNPSTLYRWAARGVLATDGRRVRLEAVKVGHLWLTSEPALARFIADLNSPVAPAEGGVRSPAARQRASDRAADQLREMGA